MAKMSIKEKIFSTPKAVADYLARLPHNAKVYNYQAEKDSKAAGGPSTGGVMGNAGTAMYGVFFREEYLPELYGREAQIIYDKMLRGDYQVKYIYMATVGTLKSARWGFRVPDVKDGQAMADACEWQLRKGFNKTWQENMNDIFSYMPKGYSIFEPVDWRAGEIPGVGKGWYLHSLGGRSQKTINEWKVENGDIEYVIQRDYYSTGKTVKIPGKNLMVFTYDRTYDNLEGVAMLRPAYGPWWRKNMFLRLLGIGFEKSALGLIVVTVPTNKMGSKEETDFLSAVSNYVTHENAYIKKTLNFDGKAGFDIEIIKLDFNAASLNEAIKQEDSAISKCVAAQFSEIAQGGNGGAYNAAIGMIDFFLNTLATEGEYTCEKLQPIFDNFCLYNFGRRDYYPELYVEGINDIVGEDFARIVNYLKASGLLTEQIEDEIYLRAKYRLPELTEDAIRAKADRRAAMAAITAPMTEEDDTENDKDELNTLSTQPRGYVSKIKAGIDFKEFTRQMELLTGAYNTEVRSVALVLKDNVMADIKSAYKTNPKNPMAEIEKITFKTSGLQQAIALNLMDSMTAGKKQGRAILKAKKAKIKENMAAGDFSAANKKWINSSARVTAVLTTDTMYKKMVLAAKTAIDKGLSEKEAAFAAAVALDDFINVDANFGAGALVPAALDVGRDEAYYDAGVELTGWIYLNGDPVTDICNWLDGKSARADDPDVDNYSPPNHFNCKSYKVPIMSDEPQPDEWDGWAVPASVASAQALLSCGCHNDIPEHIKKLIIEVKNGLRE